MEIYHRGAFSSNLGFVLAAMGSAIGLGKLWGFPCKMGANGGFPFLIIYLTFVVFCGVVVMCVEMAIGRRTGNVGAVPGYTVLTFVPVSLALSYIGL